MTEEKKIELLKSKFSQIIQASVQKDPKVDSMFLAFFNAVKDNDELFNNLAEDDKINRQAQVAQLEASIVDHQAKISEIDSVLSKKA